MVQNKITAYLYATWLTIHYFPTWCIVGELFNPMLKKTYFCKFLVQEFLLHRSFTPSLNHLLTQPLTHSLTNSLTHSSHHFTSLQHNSSDQIEFSQSLQAVSEMVLGIKSIAKSYALLVQVFNGITQLGVRDVRMDILHNMKVTDC